MPTPTRIRLRNHVAWSPLLRKGGPHERSKSGLRSQAKQDMQNEICDWQEALQEERDLNSSRPRNETGDDPITISLPNYENPAIQSISNHY